MPFWRIYHPAGAYSEDEKQAISEAVTSLYTNIPIPKFYVVCLFEEVQAGNLFVGGRKHEKFVRVHIDHIARTLP
ncbi:tautomerase family protein, partial [Sphingobium sp. AN641]|uniref:tautomerase family protein n=1 Tax=Sphingobium sp. AN641 TaxID=3133443 RepID=UPI0030BE66B7